jgi:hypothetical protein
MPDGSVLADIGLAAIDSVTITSTSVAVDKDGTIFSFGVPTTGNNILYQWVGQTLPSLTVNSGTVTISQAVGITSISVAGGTLQISSAIAVDALTLSSGSLTISNNFSSAPDYTQSGGTAYFNAALDLDSLSLTSGTITSAAYSGTFSVGVWTPTPGPGKGWVQISVAGALSIGASGNITVEAFGYPSATGTNGYSFDGQPGSGGGQQYSTACYYGADGYGGTYGTTGGGSSKTPFGAADFYNLAKLYMGSGGGGGHEDTCDGGSYYYNGGRGGGSIYITAASMNNAGTISANGQAAPQARSGGGSGGSVVLIVSGAVSNTGTIRSLGGAGNTSGGAGGKGRIRLTGGSFGTMTGTVDPAAE